MKYCPHCGKILKKTETAVGRDNRQLDLFDIEEARDGPRIGIGRVRPGSVSVPADGNVALPH